MTDLECGEMIYLPTMSTRSEPDVLPGQVLKELSNGHLIVQLERARRRVHPAWVYKWPPDALEAARRIFGGG